MTNKYKQALEALEKMFEGSHYSERPQSHTEYLRDIFLHYETIKSALQQISKDNNPHAIGDIQELNTSPIYQGNQIDISPAVIISPELEKTLVHIIRTVLQQNPEDVVKRLRELVLIKIEACKMVNDYYSERDASYTKGKIFALMDVMDLLYDKSILEAALGEKK